jgi:hypothetical protein
VSSLCTSEVRGAGRQLKTGIFIFLAHHTSSHLPQPQPPINNDNNSNNEFHPSSSNSTFPILNPATGEHLLDFHAATEEDVDKAVAAARKAFKTVWGRNVAATERARRESFTSEQAIYFPFPKIGGERDPSSRFDHPLVYLPAPLTLSSHISYYILPSILPPSHLLSPPQNSPQQISRPDGIRPPPPAPRIRQRRERSPDRQRGRSGG